MTPIQLIMLLVAAIIQTMYYPRLTQSGFCPNTTYTISTISTISTNSLLSSSSTKRLRLLRPDPSLHHHYFYSSSGEESNSDLSSVEGSGEGSNPDLNEDDLSESSLSKRWSHHIEDLDEVTSCLDRQKLIRNKDLKELKSIGNALFRGEIADVAAVVDETTRDRIKKDGFDKVAPQVKNALSKLDVARDATDFLQTRGVERLDKQARKRLLPGAEEARALQLSQILKTDIIPKLNDAIVAYKKLRQDATALELDSGEGGGK